MTLLREAEAGTAAGPGPVKHAGAPALLRRACGGVLLCMAVLPLFRLLDPAQTGFAGEITTWLMEIHLEFVLYGGLISIGLLVLGARLVPDGVAAAAARAVDRVAALPLGTAVAACAALSLLLGIAFSLGVLDGRPNLIDSYAQLLHARYWAAGSLAGPAYDGGGFWAIQNSLFTDAGWVSQYPPGHVLVLTMFLLLGAPWAAGPVLMAVTVAASMLAVHHLMPQRRALVMAGGLLLAVSPWFIVIGASYMNHVTAAAAIALGTLALIRAWRASGAPAGAWAIAAGAAFAFALATRPLSALVTAAALALVIPHAAAGRIASRRFIRINLLAVAGALPLVAALMAYNRHFFGSPFTFGYAVAMGPGMRLGFLTDPWGNRYGVQEAVAYTNADLMALGVNMFESPLSATLVIALFLLLARTLLPGERVLLAWAAVPVAANFFYWHHGNFMGPRMLHEAAPAWVFLFAVAAAGLPRMVPGSAANGRLRPRRGVGTMIALATAAGLLLMAPQRALSYGGQWHSVARTPLPHVEGPALVFVHDAWMGRAAMPLIAHRFRLDFIETLMRRNSTCDVQRLTRAVLAGDDDSVARILSTMDTMPRPGGLDVLEIAPGDNIRVRPGEVLAGECRVHAWSDRHGILDMAPLLWLGALHGVDDDGILLARDFGPDRNRQLLDAHPHRTPWVYMMTDPAAELPELVPYDSAMKLLWEGAP
jgi:hypothetical protein